MVEKIYRSAAYKLDVARDLLDFETDTGKQAITDMLTGSLDTTREDLLRSLQARQLELDQGAQQQPRSMMVTRTTARIPDDQAKEFQHRLKSLIEEFEAADQTNKEDTQDLPDYALTIAFYPSFYYKE